MKRNTVIHQKLVMKLEHTVDVNARHSVGMITFRRPWVSARKPHRCELTIIPTNTTALRMPFSRVDKFKSHSATAIM